MADPSSDYSKMKVAELQSVLKARSLPTSGKKDELIARLKDADSKASASNGPATNAVPAEPSAPVVDDQEIAAETENLNIEPTISTAPALPTEDSAIPDVNDASAADGDAAKPSFAAGLSTTDIDAEIERRKARALKFGMDIDDDEGIKLLERQKKYGASAPTGLDQALSEGRKKGGRRGGGRDGPKPLTMDDALPENRERRGRRGRDGRPSGRGRGGGGGRDRERRDRHPSGVRKERDWMSKEERDRAEARKARFAA
jgi:SAP domain-containing ribonucleoprotein